MEEKFKTNFGKGKLQGDWISFPVATISSISFGRGAVMAAEKKEMFGQEYYEVSIRQNDIIVKVDMGPTIIETFFDKID